MNGQKHLQKHLLTLLLTLLPVLLLALPAVAEEAPVRFEVHQIEVGCADAYLFRLGDITIMMDGGNDTGRKPDKLMEYLRASGIDTLDAYIVTHYHDDHSGNLNLILSEFGDENTIVYGPSRELRSIYQPLAAGVYQQMTDGLEVTLGELHILCIAPRQVRNEGRTNQDSLNVLMTYGQHRYLFTGDHAQSDQFLGPYKDVVKDVDVLKFPHHGMQPFAIGERTFRLVSPDIVLMPGSNSAGCRTFCAQNGFKGDFYDNGAGNVVIFSDGETMEVVKNAAPGQFAKGGD